MKAACAALPDLAWKQIANRVQYEKLTPGVVTRRGRSAFCWTDEQIAIFREAYTTGGIHAAKALFPTHSESALFQIACVHKIRRIESKSRTAAQSEERLARVTASKAARAARDVAKLTNKLDHTLAVADALRADIRTLDPSAAAVSVPVVIAPQTALVSTAVPFVMTVAPTVATSAPHLAKIAASAPSCDRGDSEFIRRRVAFVVQQLCAELRQPPKSVVATIALHLQSDCAPIDARGRMHVDAADAYGAPAQ